MSLQIQISDTIHTHTEHYYRLGVSVSFRVNAHEPETITNGSLKNNKFSSWSPDFQLPGHDSSQAYILSSPKAMVSATNGGL